MGQTYDFYTIPNRVEFINKKLGIPKDNIKYDSGMDRLNNILFEDYYKAHCPKNLNTPDDNWKCESLSTVPDDVLLSLVSAYKSSEHNDQKISSDQSIFRIDGLDDDLDIIKSANDLIKKSNDALYLANSTKSNFKLSTNIALFGYNVIVFLLIILHSGAPDLLKLILGIVDVGFIGAYIYFTKILKVFENKEYTELIKL